MSPPEKDVATNDIYNPEGRDEELNPTARFLAYASRVGRLLGSSVRYSAYASDVGEAFRPIVPPAFVNATYAIAFGYVGVDILYNGHRASEEGRSVPRALAHATVFQGLASLAAPFAIIHTTVSVSTKLAAQTGSKTAMRFGPTVAGLAWLPFLPSLVDEPIEELVHHAFQEYWPEEHSHLATAKAAVQDAKKGVEEQAGKIASTLKKKVA